MFPSLSAQKKMDHMKGSIAKTSCGVSYLDVFNGKVRDQDVGNLRLLGDLLVNCGTGF